MAHFLCCMGLIMVLLSGLLEPIPPFQDRSFPGGVQH